MKKIFLSGLAIFLMLAFMQSCNEPLVEEQINDELELKSANVTKTSYIVLVNDAELNEELSKLKGYEKKQLAVKSTSAKILKRAGIIDGNIEHVYGTAVKGFSVKIPPGQLKKLQDDPSVSYIEEDQIITLIQPDFKITKKPVPPSPGESTPWGIVRVRGGISGVGGTVWVIDTGIDLDHPDLNVDISRSRTFVSSLTADDDNGHGSHVAGTIAALNNDIGVIGVASGANLVAVKVLTSSGSGTTSGVIEGIDYVAANAISGDVANMSLGGGVSDALDATVLGASALCKFVLAAGNESDNANNHSPARVNGPNIYTISAMDSDDKWAYFSNYGNPPVDYCAPGYTIYSCYKNGGYATMSGTSMAAPHVAGILALGGISTDGNVIGDPDGNPDPIAVVGGGDPDPDPDNVPPTATFTYTTTDLKAFFKDTSTDSDGDVDEWSWDFGDISGTSQEENPTYTYNAAGTYSVALTVTDNDGATSTSTQNVTVSDNSSVAITLEAIDSKIRGIRYVNLSWEGTSNEVDIYRNGSIIKDPVIVNNTFEDNLGRVSGTFVYQVCETEGTGTCSNEATVTI